MTTAFVEPSTERKHHIISQMHRVSSLPEDQREEFEEIVRQLRMDVDTRVRSKTSMISDDRDYGQHHYFGIRALNDPKEKIIGTDGAQLCGEEFFGVNRFVDELLDVADIQWWAMYKGDGWSLHTRAAPGEHLDCWGSWGDLEAAVIMVNGVPLSVDETLSLYRTLQNRARRNFTQRFKRDDIQKNLERIVNGKRVRAKQLQILQDLGLYDGNELTYTGRALLEQQEALERKEIQQQFQVALDHHGLTADRKLGPHGNLFEIAHYLEQTGIKDLLDKPTLTVDECKELKSKETEFVKKYGFSFLQESMIRLYTIDDIENEFIKMLAKEVLPAVIKGADLEDTVLQAYKQKHQSDFKYRIRDAVMDSIASCPYGKLEGCVKAIEQVANEYNIGRKNIEKHLKLALRKRAQKEFSSNSLQDKYSIIEMIGKFPKLIRYKKSKLEQIARDTFDLFKQQKVIDRKDLGKFLRNIDSIGHVSHDEINEFFFNSVTDPDSLRATIDLIGGAQQDTGIKLGYEKHVQQYFDKLFKGKKFSEKLDISLQHLPVLDTSTLLTLPQEITKLGNLRDLSFVASLCSVQKDKLADYDKFAHDVDLKNAASSGYMLYVDKRKPSEIIFVELFEKLDSQTLIKLRTHFDIDNDYNIEETKSGLKITAVDPNSYSGFLNKNTNYLSGRFKEFVQAALFCSYAKALDKDPKTKLDPKKKCAAAVHPGTLKFKFGKAVPRGRSPYDIDTIEEISFKKPKKRGLYQGLEEIIEYNYNSDFEFYNKEKINYISKKYNLIEEKIYTVKDYFSKYKF
jgi:hypothetical protein